MAHSIGDVEWHVVRRWLVAGAAAGLFLANLQAVQVNLVVGSVPIPLALLALSLILTGAAMALRMRVVLSGAAQRIQPSAEPAGPAHGHLVASGDTLDEARTRFGDGRSPFE